jgi:hypothetical protein
VAALSLVFSWNLRPALKNLRRQSAPLVQNNVGSIVTIVILTLFIVGLAVMCEGPLG